LRFCKQIFAFELNNLNCFQQPRLV